MYNPKIEDKVLQNVAKREVYPVTPFMNEVFGVCIGRALLNVDIMNCTCTCRGWKMLGIPREHTVTVIISIGQNVTDFVDDWYKYPIQELIYEGSFSGIETHNMPSVDDNGLVRSITGEVFFSLKSPHTKRTPGRPRKKSLSPNFMINGLCIALVVICPTTIEKPVGILCPKCIFVTLFNSADLVYSISTNLSELVVTKSALVFEYFVPLPSLAMFIE